MTSTIGFVATGDYVCDSGAEMIRFTGAVIGNTCLRTDIDAPRGTLYVLTALPATAEGNWTPYANTIGSGGGGTVTSNYNWSTVLSGAPAPGYVHVNTANPNVATILTVAKVNNNGGDVSAYLATLGLGDHVQVQEVNEVSQFIQYEVTGAVTVYTNSVDVPVTVRANNAFNPLDGDELDVTVDHARSTIPAADVSILDSGGYYVGSDVEEALQEIGASLAAGGGGGGTTVDSTGVGDVAQFGAIRTISDWRFYPVTASGTVMTGPCRVKGVLCTTSGTLAGLYDALSATGTNLMPARALTANQEDLFGSGGVLFATGVYMAVTSGQYMLYAAPEA